MKLPITHLIFKRVSAMVALKNPEIPNPKTNIGVFSEHMGNVQQIDMLKTLQKNSIKNQIMYDIEEGNIDSRTGSLVIDDNKDFWVGEPL